MFITVGSSNITLTPKNFSEEIIQNVNVIVTTIMGNVPLDRKFGISGEIIDTSSVKGKSKLMIYLLESVQDFEPRIEVTAVDFIEDIKSAEKGTLIPRLEVRIKDEYIS